MASGTSQAIVNGKVVANNDWRSVVMLQFANPDNGQNTSCTGVILSESYAITTASCILHKETGKVAKNVKVCIGQKQPFKNANEHCFETSKIFSHHGYSTSSNSSATNNLAYLKFKNHLDLKNLNIKPASLITPAEFSAIVKDESIPDITWVGFDASTISGAVSGRKQQGTVSGAEYDYHSSSMLVTSSTPRPGNHYQGIASFIKNASGNWKLVGIVSQSTPDNLITYYPEINPCDEDPVIVRYPKPVIQVTTLITAYPVAACGMVGFFTADGYDEFSCNRLLSQQLDWPSAIEEENPIALRQQAFHLYQHKDSMNEAGEIYKLLYIAHNKGDQIAGLKLAELLLDDSLFAKDTDTARQLIEEQINQKVPLANLILAKLMLFPSDNKNIEATSAEKDKKIVELLQHAAQSGLADAQYLLARMYQLGIGTRINHKKAFIWYAQAAMQGHADGQFQLGMQWKDGRGVRPYFEVAEFWIQQAASQGQIDAQNRLGLLKPVANQ